MTDESQNQEDSVRRLKDRLQEGNVKSVLFICTGNICRSPVAHFGFKKALQGRGIDSIEVSSAGLVDMKRRPPTKEIIELMEGLDIPIEEHRSSHLQPEMIRESDLIFVMEPHHMSALESKFPESLDKIFYLSLFDSSYNGVEIQDPLGAKMTTYRHCVNRIVNLTNTLADLF